MLLNLQSKITSTLIFINKFLPAVHISLTQPPKLVSIDLKFIFSNLR